jgi:hypothetical protein
VGAQSGLVPHLSQRREIWEFPPAFGAEYVVIDGKSWWARHGPWFPDGDYELAKAALPSTGYCLRYERDGVQLWQLGGCENAPPVAPGEPAAQSHDDSP